MMVGEIQTEKPKIGRGLIIFGVLIIFLAIASTIIFTNCNIKTSLGIGLNCKSEKAVLENNVLICEELQKSEQVVSCYKNYALVKKDVSVCEDIPDNYEIYNCYTEIAQISENKITLCSNLPEGVEKPNCITAFLQIRDNLEECDLLSGEDKDYCYNTFALEKNDVQICNYISSQDKKNNCKNSVIISSVSKDVPCADSDGGINKYVKGSVIDNNKDVTYDDQCLGSELLEYSCENGESKRTEITCNCNEGVCWDSSVCKDSEDPSNEARWYQDKFMKGTVMITYKNNEGTRQESFTDECFDDSTLIDYSCFPSYEEEEFYGVGFGSDINCKNGCSEGRCLEE